jgi:hypothetical protein
MVPILCRCWLSHPLLPREAHPSPGGPPWLVSIRQFLATIAGSPELTSTYIPALQCSGDVFLMEKVCASKLVSPTDLSKLNYCGLYLNATTLSRTSPMQAETDLPFWYPHRRQVSPIELFQGLTAKHQDHPSDPTWAIWWQLLYLYDDKNTPEWEVSGPNFTSD